MERHKRTIAKTITWRITAFILTFIVIYLWTGKLAESTGIAAILNSIKMIGYYIHERIWNKTDFGRG